MRISIGLRLAALMLMLSAGNAIAQDDDRSAILAFMDRAFGAVASGDPDDWRAIQVAEGTSLSFRPGPDGNAAELEMRITTNEGLLSNEIVHGHMERWTGDPTVMIHGPIDG